MMENLNKIIGSLLGRREEPRVGAVAVALGRYDARFSESSVIKKAERKWRKEIAEAKRLGARVVINPVITREGWVVYADLLGPRASVDLALRVFKG